MVVHILSISRQLFYSLYKPCTFHRPHLTGNLLVKPNEQCFIETQGKKFRWMRFDKGWQRNAGSSFGGSVVLMITRRLKTIPEFLKNNSVNIVRNCLSQCEFVIAHRIRRGQQILSLYSRLWGEFAFKQFVNKIRKQMARKGKEFFILSGVIAFDWSSERISEEEINMHSNEIEICHNLKKHLKDNDDDDIEEPCSTACPHCGVATSSCCWVPIISGENLTVWKMEEDNHKASGLYCYKMYGIYHDVTATDFCTAFLSTEERKEWDKHVVKLFVIETEPSTNSEVLYWESKWPKFFNNRDYVYKRRYFIDEKKKQITIVNRSTQHPTVPEYDYKTRVNEYWSFMVIKPLSNNFGKPGIEFSLTYFDDPGATFPGYIKQWIAASGMPEYLTKLRIAALEMMKTREKQDRNKPEPPENPSRPSFHEDKLFFTKEVPIQPDSNPSKSEPLDNIGNYFHSASYVF